MLGLRVRKLRSLLALPRNDAEHWIADLHIRLECAKIRAGWTEEEHRLRWQGPQSELGWEPPLIQWLVAPDGRSGEHTPQ